jgi:hypothetical protein
MPVFAVRHCRFFGYCGDPQISQIYTDLGTPRRTRTVVLGLVE